MSATLLENARALLEYNDGQLLWKTTGSGRRGAGQVAGGIFGDGYVIVTFMGRSYPGHHLVWLLMNGTLPEHHIDHIDCNRSNNRIENLRECSPAENARNRSLTQGREFKGVTFHRKVGKYQAQIGVSGKYFYLGLFTRVEDAAKAYDAAATKHFGKFARLNFKSAA